jgi:hypothetical protein
VCNSGYSLCDGVCTNTDTDDDNCGRCNKSCPGMKHCVAGVCQNP